MRFFKQYTEIDPGRLHQGMRYLFYDGVCSQILGVLGGGAFLVAFALQLNASNLLIGFLAAIGPASQMLQIPSIYLVERLGNRKALVVLPAFVGRLAWLFIPFILVTGCVVIVSASQFHTRPEPGLLGEGLPLVAGVASDGGRRGDFQRQA